MRNNHSLITNYFVKFSSLLAELGDYTNDEHSIETISEFRFLPDNKQTEEFEDQVFQKWMTYK
jgi:hypothetical protein